MVCVVKDSGENDRMPASRRSYGGESADQRRDRRRSMLLEAALDLLSEAGPAAVTKRAVCARARLTDRYFYEHFTDRDALLAALAQDITARFLEAIVAAALDPAPDLRGQVHAAVDASLTFMTADPRRVQLLLNAHTAEAIYRARVTSTHTIATTMAAMTRNLLGDTAPTQIDSEITAFATVSGIKETVAAWFRHEFDISREHLTDLITDTLIASTGITATPLPTTGSHHTPPAAETPRASRINTRNPT